jgi:Cu2+-containing amine oxidase
VEIRTVVDTGASGRATLMSGPARGTMPSPVALPMPSPGASRRSAEPLARCAPSRTRAQVIGRTLWVTPFDVDERWPCREFVNQSVRDEGLPVWTAQNRNENIDVVLWYAVGIHHITRVEDRPVMPVDRVWFWLTPFGFFDRNPALDVP